MFKMDKSDGIVICKDLVDQIYKLFHDYRQVYHSVQTDQKLHVASCNNAYRCGDIQALRIQYKNSYSLYCTLINEDRKSLLKMFDAVYGKHKEIQLSLEIDILKTYLKNQVADESTIKACLEISGFFIQYGLFHNGNVFLTFAGSFSKNFEDVTFKLKIFENLLYLDAVLHRFEKLSQICIASRTAVSKTDMLTEEFLRDLRIRRYNNNQKELEAGVRLAGLYSNYSFLHFARSRYDLAYRHAISAVKSLTNDDDIRTALHVCRHASKALVANQYYIKAKFFIDEAMGRAQMLNFLKDKHFNFPEVVADYAYFLKKFGKYEESQAKYEEALKMYKDIFDCRANMHIAVVEKDLAETLLEGGIKQSYALNLIEHVILYMEQFLKTGDVKKDTTLIVEAYLIKALLLIKEFKPNDPLDQNTRKLHEVKIKLERKEKSVVLYCGITSSLYTKYLLVIIKIYFTTGNNDYAIMKSRAILNKAPGFFSKNRNLHEPIAKAEVASVIIQSCKIEDYRIYVIAATHILEDSVEVIEKNVHKHSCKELEQYYQTLMVGHRKIVQHRPPVVDPVPFKDMYHIYEVRLVNWKQKWGSLYRDNFTHIRNTISTVPALINQVKDMKAVI